MVVDDEPDVLHVIKEYLKKWEFPVDAFSSPRRALDYFSSHPKRYSLVLFDLRMAEMSGFVLAQQIAVMSHDVKLMVLRANIADMLDVPSILQSRIAKECVLERPVGIRQICDRVKTQLNLA